MLQHQAEASEAQKQGHTVRLAFLSTVSVNDLTRHAVHRQLVLYLVHYLHQQRKGGQSVSCQLQCFKCRSPCDAAFHYDDDD